MEKAIENFQICYERHDDLSGDSANRIGLLYDQASSYEAKEWYKKSADEGYDWGCYNLGLCYYNDKDVALALHYFFKAYELKGDAQADAAGQIGNIYNLYFNDQYMANEWNKR